jgi:hypothetical protein
MSHQIAAQPVGAPRLSSSAMGQPVQQSSGPTLQRRLRDTINKQQLLASSRRRLLIKREELRSSGNKLKAKRAEARDVEAVFMNTLRQAFYKTKESSESLVVAFEKVDVVRNDLGELQEDHEKIERTLVGLEWAFMDEEEEFYQFDLEDFILDNSLDNNYAVPGPNVSVQITHPPPPPPPPPFPPPNPALGVSHLSPFPTLPSQSSHQLSTLALAQRDHQTVQAELDNFKATFRTQRQEQIRHDLEGLVIDFEDEGVVIDPPYGFQSDYFRTLDSIAGREVEAQRLKEEVMHQSLHTSSMQRRKSDSHYIVGQAAVGSFPMERTLSESAVPLLSTSMTLKQRVCQWLLTDLKESVLHRTLYLNLLKQYGVEHVDDDALERWATQHWELDSSGEAPRGNNHELTATRDTAKRQYVDNDEDDSVITANPWNFGPTQLLDTQIDHDSGDATDPSCLDTPRAEIPYFSISSPEAQVIELPTTSGEAEPILPLSASDSAGLDKELESGGLEIREVANVLLPTSPVFLPVPADTAPSRTDSCQDLDDIRARENDPDFDQCFSPKSHQREPKTSTDQDESHIINNYSLNSENVLRIHQIPPYDDGNISQLPISSPNHPWLQCPFIKIHPSSRPTSEHGERDFTSREHRMCSGLRHSRSLSTSAIFKTEPPGYTRVRSYAAAHMGMFH